VLKVSTYNRFFVRWTIY